MLNQEQLDNLVDAEQRIAEAISATRRVLSSRETSLALTKLEEAALWLGKFKVDSVHDGVRRGVPGWNDPRRGAPGR